MVLINFSLVAKEFAKLHQLKPDDPFKVNILDAPQHVVTRHTIDNLDELVVNLTDLEAKEK